MEAYLDHQNKWNKTNGGGIMPVHSSGEMERIVWRADSQALMTISLLPNRVICFPLEPDLSPYNTAASLVFDDDINKNSPFSEDL